LQLASTSHDRTVRIWDADGSRYWDEQAAALARTLEGEPARAQLAYDQVGELIPELFERVARLRPSDARLWVERARTLIQQGRSDQAGAAFSQAAAAAGDDLQVFLDAGWWVVGPYPSNLPASYPPESSPDPSQLVNSMPLTPRENPSVLRWQHLRPGLADFEDVLTPRMDAADISAYALAHVYAAVGRAATLAIGGVNPMRAWLNDRPIYEYDPAQPSQQARDLVPVTLRAGRNTLLVKVATGDGPMKAYVRFVSSASASGPEQASGGREQASGGPEQPSGGREQPSGGPKEPSGGPEQPSGGSKQPSGGREQASSGPKQPSGGREQASSGPKQPSGGSKQPLGDRWAAVLADFEAAAAAAPHSPGSDFGIAASRLALGDRAARTSALRGLIDRYGDTSDSLLISACWLCGIAADVDLDRERVVRVLRRAQDVNPFLSQVVRRHQLADPLGVALLRAGRHAEALERLEAFDRARGKGSNASSQLYRALARHRLGEAEEARRLVADARAWLAEFRRDPLHPSWPLARRPFIGDRLEWRLLLGEAEKLVGGAPRSESPSRQP
jgi:Flp pilus assembly protein TadD